MDQSHKMILVTSVFKRAPSRRSTTAASSSAPARSFAAWGAGRPAGCTRSRAPRGGRGSEWSRRCPAPAPRRGPRRGGPPESSSSSRFRRPMYFRLSIESSSNIKSRPITHALVFPPFHLARDLQRGPAGYRVRFFGKYSRSCELCFGSRYIGRLAGSWSKF